MARSLEDFVGSYTIRNGTGTYSNQDTIELGYQLYIGTNSGFGDVASDGTRIGMAIVNGTTAVLPVNTNNPIYLYLVDGTLNGSTTSLPGVSGPVQMVFQISLLTVQLPGKTYKALSLLTVEGDPENAGVWGADDDG
jgi:hypothetical protein